MDKIIKTSRAFSLWFKCLIVIYPLYVLGYWLDVMPNSDPEYFLGLPSAINFSAVALHLRICAFFIYLIPTCIVITTFYYLHKLFQLYAQREFFSQRNSKYIQKIGCLFLIEVVVGIIIEPLLTLVLTLESEPGQHLISVGVSHTDISNLVVGGVVILISWIMNEAKKLEDDLAFTV